MAEKGGRMPASAYGKPPQAKGVGRKAKRHDLERPKTPGLHGSDLQQGDVQAMEQGQRIAPASTQRSGGTPPRDGGTEIGTALQLSQGEQPRGFGGLQNRAQTMSVPDPIQFLAGRNGQGFTRPNPQRRVDESRALTWLPILRQLASGPGASSALVNAFINQARLMSQHGGQPATIVDMHAADDGIEAMLDEGLLPEGTLIEDE